MKTTVIVPAYNEEQTLGPVVAQIRRLDPGFEVLVIDDGSTDKTAEAASREGARVISHPYNMGNGAAIKTGVRNASGDHLLFIDADGQHSPADIPKLLSPLDLYDMVVGERSGRARVSRFRRLGNRVFIALASYIAGRPIPDLTSGFRAVKRARAIEFLHLLPNGFSYTSTITMAMTKAGYPLTYVKLDSITRRISGKSKIQPARDGLRFIMIILRMGMLFDPLKIFLPASLLLLGAGLTTLAFQVVRHDSITGVSLIPCLFGLTILFFGLLADQLAHLRREIGPLRGGDVEKPHGRGI